MRKTLKNILMAGVIGLSSAFSTEAQAQSDSAKKESKLSGGLRLELVKSESDSSFTRPSIYLKKGNAFDVYAFGEIYSGKKEGYFGKAVVSAELDSKLQPTAELVYFGKHFNDIGANAGFGLKYKVPIPEGNSLSFKALPFWVDINKTDKQRHKHIVGYNLDIALPLGLRISSFADINADAKGTMYPVWKYGEVQVAKKITDNLNIGYYALLKSKGNEPLPKIEHAVSASANIKF